MKKVNVYELPLAFNICDQMLREVERIPHWSMAHVIMNPKAESLPHHHQAMREAYVITRGTGHLIVGGHNYLVQAGDAMVIDHHITHGLVNSSAASLEHLVLAWPPFDPADVHVNRDYEGHKGFDRVFPQPEPVECFDGAKIIAYEFGDIASVAFGWVINDPRRHKPAHYHKKTIEWIFVVEGEGSLELNGESHNIRSGDWIRVEPDEYHALRNRKDQHMVVVCVCNPCFCMDDVHYR
ncbi:MAG: hypothetical protein A3D44_03930 [Candidatus Staskawiczbacteria bacterium RIFCSPHIGHO2_02_FULL_42_22]|uniref:Cupin type-2 domain-containing protein n=1 Tax=Candidatus Staskawiczbacteria bacterium RIFCSPHIGHO2_02_FULL_42_22 TaxID=1802207 RepID=A0A1G2I1U1_9BACT|nr:MAG: hypothetical protein A3D44_03930 [Candidatus Staskawiczbacteria bacterium RIFCSPHIGHO2_02_FULL_42_22]